MSIYNSPSNKGSDDFASEFHRAAASMIEIKITRNSLNGFEIKRVIEANGRYASPGHGHTGMNPKSSSESLGSSADDDADDTSTQMQEYFHIVNVLRNFFIKKSNGAPNHCSSQDGDLNYAQIQYCITFLSQLKEHFQSEWPYEMDGSCIKIAVNHQSNSCAIKLVDKSKNEKQTTKNANKDFVDSLQSIVDILKVFMF